jgi:hypothetical protein
MLAQLEAIRSQLLAIETNHVSGLTRHEATYLADMLSTAMVLIDSVAETACQTKG